MIRAAIAAGVLVFVLLLGWVGWVALHPPQRDERGVFADAIPCGDPDECGEVEAPLPSGPAGRGVTLSGDRDLVRVFERTCAACHIAGLAGAPRIGNVEEWRPRIEKGMDALYRSALIGMPPGMPAKGLCHDCNPQDLAKLVDHMVAKSRATGAQSGPS